MSGSRVISGFRWAVPGSHFVEPAVSGRFAVLGSLLSQQSFEVQAVEREMKSATHHQKLCPDPNTLKPCKDGKSISKKGGMSSSVPAMPKLAFVLFMEDFEKSYREEYDAAVAKAGGERWDSMCEAEKRPYAQKALERLAFFQKAAESYRMMDVPEATTVAAPPIEGKLSEASTTSGPME